MFKWACTWWWCSHVSRTCEESRQTALCLQQGQHVQVLTYTILFQILWTTLIGKHTCFKVNVDHMNYRINIKFCITKKRCVRACEHHTGIILVFKSRMCVSCGIVVVIGMLHFNPLGMRIFLCLKEDGSMMSIYVNISSGTNLCHWCASHRVTFHDRTLIYVRIHAKTWHNHTWSTVIVSKLISSDVDRFVDLHYQSGHLFIPTPEFDQTMEFSSLRMWTLNIPFISVNCYKLLLETCGLCDSGESLENPTFSESNSRLNPLGVHCIFCLRITCAHDFF